MIAFYSGALFYTRRFFPALYDASTIVFDVGVFGYSEKVAIILYRFYTAFYDVLRHCFYGSKIKKACKNAAGKGKLYNFLVDHEKRKTAGKVFPAAFDYLFLLY